MKALHEKGEPGSVKGGPGRAGFEEGEGLHRPQPIGWIEPEEIGEKPDGIVPAILAPAAKSQTLEATKVRAVVDESPGEEIGAAIGGLSLPEGMKE